MPTQWKPTPTEDLQAETITKEGSMGLSGAGYSESNENRQADNRGVPAVNYKEIKVGTGDNAYRVDSQGLWLGSEQFATAPFRVTMAGLLNATGATISGAIIGGWSINATSIYTGTEDHSGYTANAGDLTIYSNGSVASIHANKFYIDSAGVFHGTGGEIDGTSTIAGITGTQISYVATSTADAVPTGLTCSSTAATVASDGSVSSQVVLTWTALSTNTFDHYLIRYKKAAATYYTYIPATTNTITIEGLVPNLSYNFGIASVNKYGTVSAYSADISQTTATSTTAPATVTGLTAVGAIQYALLEWTASASTDLSHYNIYRSLTNDSGAAVKIASVKTTYFIDGNLSAT